MKADTHNRVPSRARKWGGMDRIRVLIADDEEAVLDVLQALMASEPDLEVAGAAPDAETAIELASREQPDVALLDVRMPGGGGPRAAREILRRSPPTKIIALSAHEEVDSVLEMLRAGALGYVVKGESTDAIVRAIHRSLEEQMTFPSRVTEDVAHALAEQLHRVSRGSEQRRQEKEDRIREVLGGEGLQIVFQPIFDVREGEVVGLEALARFAALPLRSPDVWFAEAAAAGLLVDLELAAVHATLAHLDRLPEDAYVGMNLSPDTIRSPRLAEALEEAPVERLVLEMTEHARVDDYPALTTALSGLRARGLRLAVDDAGAGLASLRHIVLLDPDLIKLDVTLTQNVHQDEARRALVAALVAFGAQIDAAVVAEGVENEEQLNVLKEVGVRFAQGFFLSPPYPQPDDGAGAGSSQTLLSADTEAGGVS